MRSHVLYIYAHTYIDTLTHTYIYTHTYTCTITTPTKYAKAYICINLTNRAKTLPHANFAIIHARERDNLLYYTQKQSVPSLMTCKNS